MSKPAASKASAPPEQEPNAAMEQAKADLAAARAAANGGGIYSQLVAAQGEFPAVTKDRENPYFNSKYATFKAIVEKVRPVLARHNLGFTQTVRDAFLVTEVFNGAGQTISSAVPLSTSAATPQALGSALTYAKRYGLQCALGIAVEDDENDDDGNRASRPPARKPSNPNHTNQPTPKQEIPDV